MVREISAGAVIFKRTEEGPIYFLLHYGSGHWDFVKGHIEKGETEKQTVRRETEEETGITDLKIFSDFKQRIRYFFKRGKRETVYKEVIFYLAETTQQTVKISHEHIGFTWLNYEDAMRQLTFENARNILEKANSVLSKL